MELYGVTGHLMARHLQSMRNIQFESHWHLCAFVDPCEQFNSSFFWPYLRSASRKAA